MMKKILIVLLSVMLLSGCRGSNVISNGAKEEYDDLIKLIQEREDFADGSEFFDVTYDISKIEEGYRFYIIIDNVRTAMYDITAVAVEKNVDYSERMAANIGIFEENEYSLIPNQYNIDENFVKGINLSGTTDTAQPVLYLLVEWHKKDMSLSYREFIRIDMTSGDTNE